MKKELKAEVVNALVAHLGEYPHYYLTDISGLNAEKTAALRRECFSKNIKLVVVKNTFFSKALSSADMANEEISQVLAGPTAVMFTETGNLPARLIKDFRKSAGSDKPMLKAAYVDECTYVGEDQLETLTNIKSREELIADVVALLQSPAKNVISALQGSAGHTIAGLVKTLQERGE
ncbi:MAG: 50S ribosomal protein L10 [Rikenellaceae bacterium]